jgi:hypothetical protein
MFFFILVENDGLWRLLWGTVEIPVKMEMRVDMSHRGAARLPAELSLNELISIQVRWTHFVQSLNCAIFIIVGAGEVGVRQGDPDRVFQSNQNQVALVHTFGPKKLRVLPHVI